MSQEDIYITKLLAKTMKVVFGKHEQFQNS